MNIRTENIDALLSQKELQAKKSASAKNSTGSNFAEAIAGQATLGDAVGSVTQNASPLGVQPSVVQQVLVQNAANVAASDTLSPTDKVLNQASGALDMLESYASTLRKPEGKGNLREAYSLLEGIESQVSALKKESKETLEQNPELASLVNELEVMSVTEKMKFNRGDYVA